MALSNGYLIIVIFGLTLCFCNVGQSDALLSEVEEENVEFAGRIKNICLYRPCKNNGTCIPLRNGTDYRCVCPFNFTGRNCTIRRRYSRTVSHDCINANDCASSYARVNRTNICAYRPCKNNGTCVPLRNGTDYSCVCNFRFTGRNCTIRRRYSESYDYTEAKSFAPSYARINRTNICLYRPCKNNGTCIPLRNGTDYRCVCPVRFTGRNCTVRRRFYSPESHEYESSYVRVNRTNICVYRPCKNNGTCTPLRNGTDYRCVCPITFTGRNCTIRRRYYSPESHAALHSRANRTNACLYRPCKNNGTCTPLRNGTDYRCVCPIRFTGRNCTIRRRYYSPESHAAFHVRANRTNACLYRPCKNNGTCIPLRNGTDYRCVCPIKFTGRNCTIRRYYSPESSDCANTEGCASSYARINRTNICLYRPCKNNGTCIPLRNGTDYRCVCPIRFTGRNCTIRRYYADGSSGCDDINCASLYRRSICDTKPCKNDGTCFPSFDGKDYRCFCRMGFTGKNCSNSEKSDICDTKPCKNNGTCHSWFGGKEYRCTCPIGFYGENCTEGDICNTRPCKNNGTCLSSFRGKEYRCSCPYGFYGKNCTERNICDSKPCQNNGTCFPSINGTDFSCLCKIGFVGKNCSQRQTNDICETRPCKNNGSCIPSINGRDYHCVCPYGYSGKNCSSGNICVTNNPCKNNGTCYTSSSKQGYRCVCQMGYKGENCTQRADGCQSNPCLNNGKCIANGSFVYCECPKYYFGVHCEKKI